MSASPFTSPPEYDETFAELLKAHYRAIGSKGGTVSRDRGRLKENIAKATKAASEKAAQRRAAREAVAQDVGS